MISKPIVLSHQGLCCGIVDIQVISSLHKRGFTSLISFLSQRTLLRSCILTLWLILSYLLLRFLVLTGRKKGITTQDSENNKTHDLIFYLSPYIFNTLFENTLKIFFWYLDLGTPLSKVKNLSQYIDPNRSRISNYLILVLYFFA